jgi:hypothetical protein
MPQMAAPAAAVAVAAPVVAVAVVLVAGVAAGPPRCVGAAAAGLWQQRHPVLGLCLCCWHTLYGYLSLPCLLHPATAPLPCSCPFWRLPLLLCSCYCHLLVSLSVTQKFLVCQVRLQVAWWEARPQHHQSLLCTLLLLLLLLLQECLPAVPWVPAGQCAMVVSTQVVCTIVDIDDKACPWVLPACALLCVG